MIWRSSSRLEAENAASATRQIVTQDMLLRGRDLKPAALSNKIAQKGLALLSERSATTPVIMGF